MITGQFALALFAAFKGAALWIILAEQSARPGRDDRSLVKEWNSSYVCGFAMHATLALPPPFWDLQRNASQMIGICQLVRR
jgi:hypothetical protein